MSLTPDQEQQVQYILGKGERVALMWCLVAAGRRHQFIPKPFSEWVSFLSGPIWDPNR